MKAVLFFLLYSDVNFVPCFNFWENSSAAALCFAEWQVSGSHMRAWPHLHALSDSLIQTALLRSAWEYLGTPASLHLSLGDRY